MDKQDRKHESKKPNAPQESEEIQANPKVAETGERLKEEMDDLVDEIDKVLDGLAPASSMPPLWDGAAAERIVKDLVSRLHSR